MKNSFLPIGSIIKMHDNDLLFMIYGYANRNKMIDNDYYDYICCIYPMGIGGKDTILIKKEKIEKVIFIGYQDSNYFSFVDLLNK